MAIPWTPAELNFIAEEDILIKITPHFTAEKIELLSGEFGPFRAGRPIKVPFWLGLFFHSSQTCELNPPKWLNTSTLKKVVDRERAEKRSLTKLPQYYMEISYTFFNNTPATIDDCDQVRDLVNRIWELRVEKIRKSIVEESSERADQLQLENVTQMELHLFREPISKITGLLTSML